MGTLWAPWTILHRLNIEKRPGSPLGVPSPGREEVRNLDGSAPIRRGFVIEPFSKTPSDATPCPFAGRRTPPIPELPSDQRVRPTTGVDYRKILSFLERSVTTTDIINADEVICGMLRNPGRLLCAPLSSVSDQTSPRR